MFYLFGRMPILLDWIKSTLLCIGTSAVKRAHARGQRPPGTQNRHHAYGALLWAILAACSEPYTPGAPEKTKYIV